MYNIGTSNLYKKVILNLIRQYEPISRKKLQEYIHVRLATITDLTKEMVNDGLIIENGTISSSGLKKALLINRQYYRLIGITVTKHHLLCMIVNLAGEEVSRYEFPVNSDISGADFVDKVKTVYQKIVDDNPNDTYLGLGISISAAFDLERTHIIASDRHPNLTHIAIKEMLRDVIKIPVFFETTNNAYMLAEKWFGQANAVENALYIEISESIATGIMIHNKVVRGMSGIEGELGHTIVERSGRRSGKFCTHNNRGSLDAVSSERVIKDNFSKMLDRGETSRVTDLYKGDISKIDIRMIYDAASHGDRLCTTILEDAAEYIGVAVVNLIILLGPGLVLFGGEGIENDSIYVKMIINAIKRNMLQYNWLENNLPVQFLISEYNVWGAALGAAALGIAHFYSNEQVLSFGIL